MLKPVHRSEISIPVVWSVLLVSALVISLVGSPVALARKKSDGDDSDKWNVADPPGEWQTITIDTKRTSWTNLDVSPDGRTIVFDMLGDLFLLPIDGGEAQALTSGLAWDFQPRFSPDGSQIAFISDRDGGDNLWVMKVDGSGPRAVTKEKEHLVHNPSWSPDGQYLVAKKGFTSTRSIPAGEIWMFHAGGGGGLQLIDRPQGRRDQKNIAEPAFSIDGRYVFFSQDTTPGLRWQYGKDSTGQIFVIKRLDRETGEVEVFVSGPGGAIRPTPSPDGRYLAFIKRMPGLTSAIYLKDLESGKEWAVHDRFERDLQETNGSQGNTTAFAWTPDARSIVFWSGGEIRRLDVESGRVAVIPVHVRVEHKYQKALRVPVEVAPEQVDVRMLRWVERSPDGSHVVFQALGRLWLKNLETGEQRPLTRQQDHHEFYPSFSRDGRWVVYTTWDDQELGSVRVVEVDGGRSRTLTPQPGHYVEPGFSPDGSLVVYRKITGGFLLSPMWSLEPGIYVVPRSGGAARRVSRSGSSPQFGSRNDRVLFTDRGQDGARVLKSVDLEGHEERTHLEGQKVTEFSVSPDGRWVAFTEEHNAYVAPFAITGKTIDVSPSMKSVPVRQVSKRSGENLHWSGTSDRLCWAHGPVLYERELKDAFAFLAGAPEELPEPTAEGTELGFEVPADAPSGTIAIVGGRVVTMRDAWNTREVINNGVVLVEGNRITAVGRAGEVQVPRDAYTVDVSGKTVLPGLLDAHAHGPHARSEITPQQNWVQYANLAFGVTTIHDPSNDTSSIFSAAEMQRAGMIVAPRIYSTGSILYGAHVPGITAKIDSYDDALFHVQRMKDVGAISVKSYQMPRRDQRQQIVAAGRELGIMVVPEGGMKFQHNMTEIIDGHTGIEHSLPIKTAYDDVLQLWPVTEAGYTPTFVVSFGGLEGERYFYQHDDVWKNERLMRYVPRSVVEPRAIRRTKAPEEHYNHIWVAAFAKELADRGIMVNIGAHGQLAGLAAHWEMWMMEQGGFTPWEALRGGTISGARHLGLDGDIGSIEVGKLADLIVVDGNPLDDLRRSEYVSHTMLNGRLYDVATMNQIAPDRTERDVFYFETEGGDTIHPATQTWLKEHLNAHGCPH